MKCHEVDYKIQGHDIQFVEVELDPNETVIAEAGAMTYMEGGINFETKMGDGSTPDEGFMSKMFNAGKRAISGESIFLTHFTNEGHQKSRVAFAGQFPGSIVPVDLKQYNGELLCQNDAFLAAAFGTQVDIALNKRLGAGFFGGEGFILQRLVGDGMAFIHAGGSVICKELNNETLRLDPGCLVAFTSGLDFDIQTAGGLKSMAFGGEGAFLSTLSGSGKVWIQSMPFSRTAERIFDHMPSQGGSQQGETTIFDVVNKFIK
tara:strand:+ start:630 stop:1412 length:783 start_codon:yes stop_codon:yes gene_type:complete